MRASRRSRPTSTATAYCLLASPATRACRAGREAQRDCAVHPGPAQRPAAEYVLLLSDLRGIAASRVPESYGRSLLLGEYCSDWLTPRSRHPVIIQKAPSRQAILTATSSLSSPTRPTPKTRSRLLTSTVLVSLMSTGARQHPTRNRRARAARDLQLPRLADQEFRRWPARYRRSRVLLAALRSRAAAAVLGPAQRDGCPAHHHPGARLPGWPTETPRRASGAGPRSVNQERRFEGSVGGGLPARSTTCCSVMWQLSFEAADVGDDLNKYASRLPAMSRSGDLADG